MPPAGRVVFIDAKATEPTLAAELIAAYTAGPGSSPGQAVAGRAAVGLEGDPMELANRLLAVQDWSEPWYERVASRAIRLACGADIGPPRSAEELLARLTAPGPGAAVRRHRPGRAGPPAHRRQGVRGAALRYGDFFDALAGRFDGTWSYDQADLAVLSLPVLAAREDASAAFRLLLEDLGHYGVARKDRDDQGMTVYLEEFSAVSDGARAAIDLAERLRTPGSGWCSSSSPTKASATSTRRPGCWAARPRSSSIACPSPSGSWPPPGPSGPRSRPGSSTSGDQTARVTADDPAAPGRPRRRAPRRGRRSMDHRRRPQPPPPGRRDPVHPAAGRAAHPHRDGLAVVEERPPWVVDLPDQEPAAATVVAGSCPHRGRSCRHRRRSCRGCASSSPPPSARATSWPCAGC